jgi:hypothetical protein
MVEDRIIHTTLTAEDRIIHTILIGEAVMVAVDIGVVAIAAIGAAAMGFGGCLWR